MKNKKSRMVSAAIAAVILVVAIFGVDAMDIEDEEAEELQQTLVPADVAINGADDVQDELDGLRKQEALEKLKEVLGISGLREDSRKEVTPQFMMELYHTVTDADGKTRRKNPYNAKVVRSFIERDSSLSHFYIFNVSGLEQNESVLEAELHIYRKRSSPKSVHPSVLTSPYYLIRVYQVLPDKNLDEPDLHRLLNVHYVGAYASGWQVFNVKQAVLSWLSGISPNLGLLVTASTIFGDRVTVEFARRIDDDVAVEVEESLEKQPILVLFNADGSADTEDANNELEKSTYERYARRSLMDTLIRDEEMSEERRRGKRHEQEVDESRRGQLEEAPEYVQDNRSEIFVREKKERARHQRQLDENAAVVGMSRRKHEFVPRRKSLEQTLTSMDIYQRAMLRERLNSHREGSNTHRESTRAISRRRHRGQVEIESDRASITRRRRRSTESECRKPETEPCARRELYVNFEEIGMQSFIVAPPGYAAYQCRGHCKSPLSQDQKPTNHATIQGIIHKMNLAQDQGVEMPCCVPVNLTSISILYLDERDNVVLKNYADMVVGSCGCR